MKPSIRARRAYTIFHQAAMRHGILTDALVVEAVDRDFEPKDAAERDKVIDDVLAVRDALEELGF